MSPLRPTVAAVDTNVLVDFAKPREMVHDAIALMRERIEGGVEFWVQATALQELMDICDNHNVAESALAAKALDNLRAWGFKPKEGTGVGRGIEECIADKIREKGLLPDDERNDSFIVAEAALADATILLTSDGHMLGMDMNQLKLLLRSHDVGTPIVVSPAKIVTDFFPKKRRA